MTISSMTGFARAQGQDSASGPSVAWTWEARSVNGKGLDVRLRLPPGYEGIEIPAREAASQRFKRGNLSLNLQVRQDESAATSVVINEALLERLMERAKDLPPHVAPPTFDGLLGVRGVLQAADETVLDEEARAAHEAAVLATLGAALDGLASARVEEGARLESLLREHLETIASLVERAERTAQARPEAAQARLRQQLSQLLEASPPVSEDRLAQELAILVTKLDIREELDRLRAHVAQARSLLDEGGPTGRRLDFLCQEFNREANTLCSKSQDSDLTRIGLDLKVVVDQFREQVQNIE